MKPHDRSTSSIGGAVIAETALIVSLILLLIFGTVQSGIIGYAQMLTDGAAFYNAHQSTAESETANGSTYGGSSSSTRTQAVFPQIAPAAITQTIGPAPAPTALGVDYGYNSTNPVEQTASVNNRHGGVAMMLPSTLTSTVKRQNAGTLLGVNIDVSGSAIEPLWMENGEVWGGSNVAVDGTGASGQGNIFRAGDDTTPYMISIDAVQVCRDPMPWGGTNPCGFKDYLFIGTAAYLDVTNQSAANPGVSDDGAWATGTEDHNFQDLACHQRAFALVDNYLASTTLAAMTSNPSNHVPQSGDLSTLVTTWNGFAGDGTAGVAADTAIQAIYSWDAPYDSYVGNGAPYTPNANCASVES